ncbi:hypothetical protein AVEN_175147-1 [Araneus ventricosus]|uniref:Peptidase A2 domain-containing protein n=1 Tax=Araneus ventricosus TaxID=182803 RepID=A0A4Y2VAA8_ARAVE|nr:hypothetical protein AVEN_89487-1 [Araneus ventricosus]GBO21504.1 hypothetical protein AVEN_175147-1 [Araneus ventricosus]
MSFDNMQKDKKVAEENVITVEAITFQVDVQLMVNSAGATGSRIIFLVSVSKSVNRVCQNNPEEFTNSANSCKYPPEPFFVGNVSADSMSSSWQDILLINDRPVNFKIDTGAQANIISKKLLDDIYRSGVNVTKTSVKLSTYTGQTIELLGCTTLPVNKNLNSPVIHLDFLVTKNSYQPILGLTASADKLRLIRKCDNVNSVNCCKSISNLLC